MNIHKVKIKAGLGEPVRILQVTDIHLAFQNEQDTKHREEQQYRCDYYFQHSLPYLREAVAYGKTLDHVVFTGDAVDAALRGSLEVFQQETRGLAYTFACGNHEYLPYIFGPESAPAGAEAAARCQSYLAGDIFFQSKIIKGLNIITLDNAMSRFSPELFHRLREEDKKGLPMVLFFHVPVFEESAVDKARGRWGGKMDFFMGMTEEMAQKYAAAESHIARGATREMLEYIGENPRIIALFAGHLHMNHEGIIPWGKGKPQYICNGLHDGDVCEIEVV